MGLGTSIRKWSPSALHNLLRKRTVDTALGPVEEDKLRMVADPYPDGTLWAWHVTDDPENILRALREGLDLQEGRYRDWPWPCPGIFVSAVPDYWTGVSRRKWKFLYDLEPEKKAALAGLIRADILERGASGYITKSETESALQNVDEFLKRDHPPTLVIVANQPWNVPIIDIARSAGIADPFEPFVVSVVFAGRYFDMEPFNRHDAAIFDAGIAKYVEKPAAKVTLEDTCVALRDWGYDGAFTRSSVSTEAQLVIWNAERILRFGDWTRPR
jgi:hypothetical protein